MTFKELFDDCLNKYDDQPLLIPSKIIALGASTCLKKAYFALMADSAPADHTPYAMRGNSVKIHDLLAYVLPGITYSYLEFRATHSNFDLNSALDKVWKEIEDYIEAYSVISKDDFLINKSYISLLLRGYLAVLDWLIDRGFDPNNILIFTERWIVSSPIESAGYSSGENVMLPVIGVPDVIIISGDNAAVIDWKIIDPEIERPKGNDAHYIQVAIYEELIRRLIKGKIYSFLIYITPKRKNIKVASFYPLKIDEPDIKVTVINQNQKDLLKKAEFTAMFLYGITFCYILKDKELRENIFKTIRQLNLVSPSRKAVMEGKYPLCNYCHYKSWCLYRFAKNEELSQDEKTIRRGFIKLYKGVLKKKSEEYKNLVKWDECVDFDKMQFNDSDPREIILEKSFRQGVSHDDLMRYSLGRTTVYLFLNDPLRGSREIFSPALFGRYEDDEIEFVRKENKVVGLIAKVRMISNTFAIRWLPLYFSYKMGGNAGRLIFRNVRVCRGIVPMNIELRALSKVESSLISSLRGEEKDEFLNMLEEIIKLIADEYA